jgi:hypothetical protein
MEMIAIPAKRQGDHLFEASNYESQVFAENHFSRENRTVNVQGDISSKR